MLTQTESSIPTNHHVANADDQTEILEKMKTKCMEKIMEEERLRSSADVIENITKRCPRVWDGIMCWSEANPGDTSIQPCPDYIAGFDTTAKATRQCLQSGDWFYRDDPERTWTNYSQCIPNSYASLVISYPQLESNESIGTYLEEWIPVVKTISRLGYTVSLFTLIVAFVIMASIKKLRCPRNTLHMHLFASFIMRAFMSLLKDSLFINGIGLSHDVFVQNGETFVLSESGHSWECKMVVSLWQFFIMANYSWVLMEGLYLHNLIFLPMSSDTSSITMYAILGWGIPVVVVVPWIILRAVLEDTLCWTTNDNSLFFLVIRIPIVISILINFAMFVNIVRVVYLKLQSSASEDTRRDRYRRWAKSTLVLVPLFGVHYAVFLGMSYSIGVNQVMEIIWLFCDQFFASFQGSVIAILYCFMNGEVRAELNKKWICFFKRLKHKGGKAHWLPSSENSADNNTSNNGAGGPLFMFPQNGRKLHSIASKGKKVCFEGIENDGGTESDDKHVTSMEREQNIKLKSFNMMNLPHFGRQMSAPAGYATSDAKLSNRGRWILQENGGKGSRLFSKALGQSEFFQNTKRLVKKWSQTGGVGKNREESPLNSSSCCTTHFSVDCEENAIENGEFIGDEESMCQSPMQSEEISPKFLQQQGAERHGIPLQRSYSVGAYLKTHYTDDKSENWKTDVKEDLFDEDDQYPKS